MCKSRRCSLHNKFRYGFSYQSIVEKLLLGSQHLSHLFKQLFFFFFPWAWQMQFWPCSHPFAILVKRSFSNPVTLTTSAVLSVFFGLLLLCCIKLKASSFSKLFLVCPCLVISHSALWNRLSLLFNQWLPALASTCYKNTKAVSSSLPLCPSCEEATHFSHLQS